MISRRALTRLLASLMAAGLVTQALTPLAGACQVDEPGGASGEAPVAGVAPAELDEADDQDEDEVEDKDDGEVEDKDDGEVDDKDAAQSSGKQLGLEKKAPAEPTPAPVLTGEHDNGKHLGLVKPHKNEKPRGSGFWRQQGVSGQQGKNSG